MNKETKKAAAMIEEKAKTKAETIKASKQAIQDKSAKLESLQTKLASAATEEAYTEICREIRDTESAIEFHKKRLDIAERQGVLTEAEEKAIREQLEKAKDSINAETAGEIQATAQKLFTLLACRETAFFELNNVVSQLKGVNAAANMSFFNANTYPQNDKLSIECTNLYFKMKQQELASKGISYAGGVKI